MSSQRTHYVTTTDGVTIGGTVHGQGRPFVIVHEMLADGDLDWRRCCRTCCRSTCYLPSLRCRGLSDDHPDLSPRRMVEDVLTYVDSLEARPDWSVGPSAPTWH